MRILLWTLGLPTLATGGAMLWARLSTRPRPPADPRTSIAAWQQQTAAMLRAEGHDREPGPAPGNRTGSQT